MTLALAVVGQFVFVNGISQGVNERRRDTYLREQRLGERDVSSAFHAAWREIVQIELRLQIGDAALNRAAFYGCGWQGRGPQLTIVIQWAETPVRRQHRDCPRRGGVGQRVACLRVARAVLAIQPA